MRTPAPLLLATCVLALAGSGCGSSAPGRGTGAVARLDCPAGPSDVEAGTLDYLRGSKGSTTPRAAAEGFANQHGLAASQFVRVTGSKAKPGKTVRFDYRRGGSTLVDVALVDDGNGWLVGGFGACKSLLAHAEHAARVDWSPTGSAPRLATFRAGREWQGLTFRYPASWRPCRYREAGAPVSVPIVYLSNQRLHPPCTHRRIGNAFETKCGQPLDHLDRGRVLLEWSENGVAGWTFSSVKGAPLTVDGQSAKLSSTDAGCRRLGADAGLLLTVKRPDATGNWWGLRACIAGPGVARSEAEVRALIASTQFRKLGS